MEQQTFHDTEAGTPQGGICSPVLANMTLDGLERRLRDQYPTQGKGSKHGAKAMVNLVRFADDFIITGATREVLEDEVKPLVERFMQERGLTLSAEKTVITHSDDGVDFLGQHVRKYAGKALTKPARKTMVAFLQKVREIIKANKQATAGKVITLLRMGTLSPSRSEQRRLPHGGP